MTDLNCSYSKNKTHYNSLGVVIIGARFGFQFYIFFSMLVLPFRKVVFYVSKVLAHRSHLSDLKASTQTEGDCNPSTTKTGTIRHASSSLSFPLRTLTILNHHPLVSIFPSNSQQDGKMSLKLLKLVIASRAFKTRLSISAHLHY